MIFDSLFPDTYFGGDFAVGLAPQSVHQKYAPRARRHRKNCAS